ncbi:MAG: hypothetical protein O9350_03800 [Microcystis sp. LE19-388.1G]|nr:hypothetical protein [Microcystis sp. LE19-388.1G]
MIKWLDRISCGLGKWGVGVLGVGSGKWEVGSGKWEVGCWGSGEFS